MVSLALGALNKAVFVLCGGLSFFLCGGLKPITASKIAQVIAFFISASPQKSLRKFVFPLEGMKREWLAEAYVQRVRDRRPLPAWPGEAPMQRVWDRPLPAWSAEAPVQRVRDRHRINPLGNTHHS
jgi:hypothetical protein